MPTLTDRPVVVVGAGLAGLSCAVTLHEAGAPVTVIESGDDVGGRVRTDEVDGFLLDRGFQVLLTAYPELDRQLDVEALELELFDPGALIHTDDRFWELGDPLQRPASLIPTLRTAISRSVATPSDLIRLLALRLRLSRTDVPDLLADLMSQRSTRSPPSVSLTAAFNASSGHLSEVSNSTPPSTRVPECSTQSSKCCSPDGPLSLDTA